MLGVVMCKNSRTFQNYIQNIIYYYRVKGASKGNTECKERRKGQKGKTRSEALRGCPPDQYKQHRFPLQDSTPFPVILWSALVAYRNLKKRKGKFHTFSSKKKRRIIFVSVGAGTQRKIRYLLGICYYKRHVIRKYFKICLLMSTTNRN
jgi:hypothetical protein